jgi:hypothetical protein
MVPMETPDPLNNILDQVPMQLVVNELENTAHRLTSENVSLRARKRYLEDVIRGLQEQNVGLQGQLNQLDAEGQNAVEPKQL